MRKIKVLSSILAVSLLFTACGGSSEKNEFKEAKVNKNAVFREEVSSFELEDGDISQILVQGDTLYVEQYVYNYEFPEAKTEVVTEETVDNEEAAEAEEIAIEETVDDEEAAEVEETTDEEIISKEEVNIETALDSENVVDIETEEDTFFYLRKIIGYDSEGKIKSRHEERMNGNSSGGAFAVSETGEIYSIIHQYPTYENEDNTEKVYLAGYAADGAEKWKIHLNENTAEEGYFYVSSLHCNDKNQIIVDSSRGIEIYDEQGNPVKLIDKQNGNDCRLFKIRDEKFAMVSSDGNSANIQTLDIQSGVFGEKIKLPFNYYRYQISSGNVYDMYLCDEYGIYGYNMGDSEVTKLMDYISSDFSYGSLYHVAFIDENTFFAYYYNEGSVLSKFTKVAPEDIVMKTDLTVGCYYLDYNLKKTLIEFNKNNQEYRLNIKDYSMYDTMEDYSQGLTKLNTDIVSGNVPDIMILNTQMPFESFAAKGVFADLNTFLEKDAELKKEDLLPNILQALSSEDGLYRIAPSFSITTFAAKAADVGKKPGWTMAEAMELLKTKPEGTQLLSEITASTFLYYTVWICGEQYVDWDTGKCFFDSEGFIKTLEFAKSLPKEIDYSAITDDESYWQEMETQYRNGKTILSMQHLSGFRDYNYAKQGVFGEDITLIGFPVDEGMGAGLSFSTPMAISALSKNQDVAWEFVKTFFREEYQESLNYDFPIRISSLKKLEEKAWEKPYFIDEQGDKQEYDDYFYVNGMEIQVEPMKPGETAEFMDYIQSLDTLCIYNETLYNIIMEEAAGYLEGQKTAEEVAKVIQSRAKIYVSENS